MRRSKAKSMVRGGAPATPIPPYSASTCAVVAHDRPIKWLGVRLGDEENQFAEKVTEAAELHAAISTLDDPALELVLTRASADVGRIVHLLRAAGPSNPAALESFDDLVRAAVGRIVHAEVGDDSAEQASWGVKSGGLGLRRATALALPAHAASLAEAEQLVAWLTHQCEQLGVSVDPSASVSIRADTVCRQLHDSFDCPTTRAALLKEIAHTRRPVDPTAVPLILRDRPPSSGRPPPHPPPPGEMVQDAGGSPDDRDSSAPRAALQHRLMQHIDHLRLRQTIDPLRAQRSALSDADLERLLRLQDLADRSTCHDWIWATNLAHGRVLSPNEYISAVRVRLGIPVSNFVGTRQCAECSADVSAASLGPHALLCGRGVRIVGHNHLRDHLLTLARASDPAARLEVALANSVPNPDNRRPADILLSASPLGGGAAGRCAVDVGITAPHNDCARRSDLEPTEEHFKRKIAASKALCDSAGWQFLPFIVSAYGRPHPDAKHLVHKLAVRAAREYVVEPAPRLEATWWRNASTILMARVAAMVERCRPAPPVAEGLAGARESLRGVVPHPPLPRSLDPHAALLPRHELVAGADAPVILDD